MPSTDETTINDVWLQQHKTGPAVELITLPSGQTCKAKRPGLEGLMLSGQLLQLDTLTSVVDRQHVRRVKGGHGADHDEINAASLMKDPESLKRILRLADSLLPQVVVEPQVVLHWTTDAAGVETNLPLEGRDPNLVYTDYVSYEDKMFLLQYAVGGSRDVDRFREESQAALGGVAPGEGIPRKTKRPNAGKRNKSRS